MASNLLSPRFQKATVVPARSRKNKYKLFSLVASIVRKPPAHLHTLRRAALRSHILVARFFPAVPSAACTYCLARSTTAHRPRLIAADSPRNRLANSGASGHSVRQAHSAPAIRPSARESPQSQHSREESFPVSGSRKEKVFWSRNQSVWSCLRCPEEWCGLAFRRKAARGLLQCSLRRDVARAPENRLVIPVYAAASIMRRPARLVLKEANRANASVPAQVKPVQRAPRNAHQVAGFNLNRHHGALRRMNMKKPATCDDVAHLIFIMRVLDVELRKHRVQSWSARIHVNHIRRRLSAAPL